MMQKWDYEVVHLPDNWILKHMDKENTELLKEYGQEGWELVGVMLGVAFFKRPIRNTSPMTIRRFDKDGKEIESS